MSKTPGEINLADDRDDTQTIPIDLPALHKTIDAVREILGYPTYDVSLSLIDEDYMREVNAETRGVDSSTDVLSFSFTECVEPGILEDVPQYGALIGEMYNLGDMLICVDYVAKRCEDDREKYESNGSGYDADMIEGEVLASDTASAVDSDNTEAEDDDEYEFRDIEVEVLDEWDDRGVAPALLTTFDPQIRIHMLIVHGMLHLVGYDHIEDDDYELMVEKEDEVMAELKRRLGDNFGLGSKALTAE
jgi:probable rRNA maturation factor